MICRRFTNLLICRLKSSLSSIWIPRSSTDDSDFITWLSTWNFIFVRSELFLFNTMAWNLSGFTITLFFLNHSIGILLSDSDLFIRSEIVCAQADSVSMGWGRLHEEKKVVNWKIKQKSTNYRALWYACNDIFKVDICVVYIDTLFSIL